MTAPTDLTSFVPQPQSDSFGTPSVSDLLSDSGSSSTTSTASDGTRPTIIPRSKRVREQAAPAVTFPSERSSPTPSSSKSIPGVRRRDFADITGKRFITGSGGDSEDDTPRPIPQRSKAGHLRLKLEGLTPRHVSESRVGAPLAPVLQTSQAAGLLSPSASTENMIRKKSGEPVKSSLKSAKRPAGLTVITGGSFAKSEPSTPTHTKAVHFDAKLEHVKLFLAEQKPIAVSRDGSPTTDNSGTDNEFPSFIYGASNSDQRAKAKHIDMLLPNMPSAPMKNADVALEELVLSQDTRIINGRVRVRNVAFEKWLAVRFTFDWWQTTSEVTARYAESLEGGTFDIFTFSIRLHDMWGRIEEKTMFLALRYTVAGREIWDNNGGQNYLVKFVESKIVSEQQASSVDEEDNRGPIGGDLKIKLEQVAKARENAENLSRSRQHRFLATDEKKPSRLTFDTPLSSRYDFSTALKNPWKGSVEPPPRHSRTHTYPSNPNAAPWPRKRTSYNTDKISPLSSPRPLSLGSPRDIEKEDIRQPLRYDDSEVEDLPFSFPHPPSRREERGRNHHRGYFDRPIGSTPSVRKTPTGSPVKLKVEGDEVDDVAGGLMHLPGLGITTKVSASADGIDRQPTLFPRWNGQGLDLGGSGESTPSATTQSSSSSSPSLSPTLDMTTSDELDSSPVQQTNLRREDSYSQFLNRFCFYTGGDSLMGASGEAIPRSHSASSVEEFLWSQSPPTNSFSPHMRDLAGIATPTRSPSFDDIACRSGSTTPTSKSFLFSDSRAATPILG
ncbi:hypothetical protein BV22DRAFT_1126772 [Leucogyrophana mollusca]|uniref:Uncharacterized protein n=1 Tax=Leucogyrophana mollusca TaxID=85980 RepID=A0ACB8BQH8_9AGAM|nr:hypothetical protein BV22DRAFT_1126772 [Leucogyrophana mollusca]